MGECRKGLLRIRVGKTLPILSFMLSITRYLLFSSFLLLMQPLFTKGQHARLKIPQTSIWDHELIKNLFTWVKVRWDVGSFSHKMPYYQTSLCNQSLFPGRYKECIGFTFQSWGTPPYFNNVNVTRTGAPQTALSKTWQENCLY